MSSTSCLTSGNPTAAFGVLLSTPPLSFIHSFIHSILVLTLCSTVPRLPQLCYQAWSYFAATIADEGKWLVSVYFHSWSLHCVPPVFPSCHQAWSYFAEEVVDWSRRKRAVWNEDAEEVVDWSRRNIEVVLNSMLSKCTWLIKNASH